MHRKHLKHFLRMALDSATRGGRRYHVWMGALTLIMLVGAYGYSVQLREGLGVTGMTDHVSWGLYISNFTFLVGLAAASVMLVLPAYVLKDVDFSKAVLIAEGVAVSALTMCLAFVVADLGNPLRGWHLIPDRRAIPANLGARSMATNQQLQRPDSKRRSFFSVALLYGLGSRIYCRLTNDLRCHERVLLFPSKGGMSRVISPERLRDT
jgi:hypothetical protein